MSTPPTSLRHGVTPGQLRLVTVASSVGTIIEWYDFFVFAILTGLISKLFFAGGGSSTDFLKTLAIFAAGFVVRPLGAVFFGHVGDLVGRKYTFLVTLLLMGGSTFAIGLLPTYAEIGIWAPLLLTGLRLLQGLALGGEYGGAATYIAEHAPDHRRGYFTSWLQTTAFVGFGIAIIVVLLTQKVLGMSTFDGWGWRVPFLVSGLLISVSYYIRRQMSESPVFRQMKAESRTSTHPIRDTFSDRKMLRYALIGLFGATIGMSCVNYAGSFYVQIFLTKTLMVDGPSANLAQAIGLLASAPMFVLFGWLSDVAGRKRVMMSGLVLALICYPLLFMLMAHVSRPHPTGWEIAQISGIILLLMTIGAMVYGPLAAFLCELFPAKIRYTAISVPYNIGAVFGGLTPFMAQWMVDATGNRYAGLVYPLGAALLTLVVGLIWIPETNHVNIED